MIVVGFYWRLVYWRQISLFIDEFVTLLAAQMIVQKGIPQLPSGVFYDNGLLFSYIVSAFIGLTGFSEAVARFPSILFSLLSVAVTFCMGRRFFSPAVGLLACGLLALAPEAVMWGARSRAYAQFQLWGLVGIWAMVEGVTGEWRGRWRALFWLAMVGAALSHLAGVVLMLCSLAAAVPAWYVWTGGASVQVYRCAGVRGQVRNLVHNLVRTMWPDGLLAVAVLVVMAILTVAGQPSWIGPVVSPVSATEGVSFSALAHVSWVDILGLVWPMLGRAQYVPWTVLLLVNLVVLLHGTMSRKLRRTEAVTLYLHGVWMLMVLALTLVSPWHMPRYVLPLYPVFFLLGSNEMANAVKKLSALPFDRLRAGSFLKHTSVGGLWLAGLIVTLVGMLLWRPLQQVTTKQECGYDLAFHYVQDRWREGDAIMTFNGSGSCVYLGRNDYYPIQIGAWLLETADGPVERYSGAQWIESVAQLETALAGADRTWYVIDDVRFATRVCSEMQEAIVARFQPVFKERGVGVFLYEGGE